MKLTAVLILTFCVCLPTTGLADANDLLEGCTIAEKGTEGMTKVTDVMKSAYCIGYLSGVTDTNSAYSAVIKLGSNEPLFCLPKDGIQRGQQVRIVTKYLRDHPEELHYPDALLAIKAFQLAFPCP